MMPIAMQTGVDPLTLHYGMFLTSVQKLGSDEQGKLWIKDIRTL